MHFSPGHERRASWTSVLLQGEANPQYIDMATPVPEKAQEEPSGAGFGVGEEVLVSAAGTEPGLELQVIFEVRPYLTGLRSKQALARQ
jgi:hypothetical protein